MKKLSSLVVVVTAAACAALAAPARAQWGASASMFTEDGVEIGVDGRVFALFAMMNSLGYDRDDVKGPPPLFRPQWAPARQKVRANLNRPGSAVKALGKVLDKNPKDPADYVAAALELGPAPNFEAGKDASALAQAISEPMKEWWNEEGGAALLRVAGDEAKPAQKKLLPLLDKAVKSTTQLVRLGDAQEQLLDDTGAQGRVALVLNDLDTHGTLVRVTRGDTTYIVVGPSTSDKDDELAQNAVVAAYARTLVLRDAKNAAKAGTLSDTFGKLSEGARTSLKDEKVATAELLACAFMRHVRGKGAACAGSPLAGEAAADEALAVLEPRVAAFATDTVLLSAATAKLLEAPAPPPPPVDATAVDGKDKGKGGNTNTNTNANTNNNQGGKKKG